MPTNPSDDLAGELSSLFLAAAEAAAQRVRELGWPLRRPATHTSIRRDRRDPGAWSSSTREVGQTVLAPPTPPLHRLAPLLTPAAAAAASACASTLVDTAGSNLPFWSPFEGRGWLLTRGASDEVVPADYAADAGDWTARHLVLPALYERLAALPSLDTAVTEDGRRFAADVMRVATADRLVYRVTAPLGGLDIRGPSGTTLTSDEGTVRRLSDTERGSLFKDWGVGSAGAGAFIALPLVALELSVSTPRDRQNPDIRESVAKWLLALQLNGYCPSGYAANFRPDPSWVMPISMNVPLTLPYQPRMWSSISPAAFERIRAAVAQLQRHNVSEPNSPRELALHRFHLGNGRSNAVDAVLDFVIALESLLHPFDADARHAELGYRFRLHGARYLARTRDERREISRQLASLYGLRSRLVHGSGYPTAAEIEGGRASAETFARRGLLRAVRDGLSHPRRTAPTGCWTCPSSWPRSCNGQWTTGVRPATAPSPTAAQPARETTPPTRATCSSAPAAATPADPTTPTATSRQPPRASTPPATASADPSTSPPSPGPASRSAKATRKPGPPI